MRKMKQKNAMLVTLIDTDNAMLPIQTDILLKKRDRGSNGNPPKTITGSPSRYPPESTLERDQHLVWHVLRLSAEHLMLEFLDPERVLVSHPERYLSLRCMFIIHSVCI